MATDKDYYSVLGVSKEATQAEIKRAYRRLVKEYHPDHNKSEEASQKFKEVQKAYEVLSNTEKKSAYDKFGHAGVDGFGSGFGGAGQGGFGSGFGGAGRGGVGGAGAQTFTNFSDFSDFFEGSSNMGGLFEEFFRGTVGGGARGASRGGPRKGDSLKYTMEVDLETAAFGTEQEISYSRVDRCDVCEGTGSKTKKTKECTTCKGSGQVRRVQQTPLGALSVSSACPECKGTGKVPEEVCVTCAGLGYRKTNEKMKIKIPKGSYDGMELRFSGKGDAGENGGEYGDLYVEVQVTEHDLFTREGDDIIIQFRVPIYTAVLGGEVEVPTLHGDKVLRIPAGTQFGETLTLKNMGVPKKHIDSNGDHQVRIVFDVPKKLSKKERKAWEKLAR